MGVIDRRKKLFENIVRLRRAARELPDNRDLVSVKTALEEELGETVSRRLAAGLLGMSHTGLSRWIKAGDVPVVFGPKGREEVPVSVLLDLYDAVEQERKSGHRRGHLLEPTMIAGHDRAQRLRTRNLAPSGETGAEGHRKAELRSLAYHRALAPRLRRPTLDDALHLVWKWREQGKLDPRYAEQWEEVLQRPVNAVRRIITEDSQWARDLRQSSPLAGMLSEPERRKVFQAVG